jgi:hypothetical protein
MKRPLIYDDDLSTKLTRLLHEPDLDVTQIQVDGTVNKLLSIIPIAKELYEITLMVEIGRDTLNNLPGSSGIVQRNKVFPSSNTLVVTEDVLTSIDAQPNTKKIRCLLELDKMNLTILSLSVLGI